MSTDRSIRGLVRLADLAEQHARAPAQFRPGSLAQLLRVAAAGDQQPQVRGAADDQPQRVQQHRHALARLVEPAEEADRAARPAGSRAARSAARRTATSTPFGMITASPPRCSTCTCRASR